MSTYDVYQYSKRLITKKLKYSSHVSAKTECEEEFHHGSISQSTKLTKKFWSYISTLIQILLHSNQIWNQNK